MVQHMAAVVDFYVLQMGKATFAFGCLFRGFFQHGLQEWRIRLNPQSGGGDGAPAGLGFFQTI